jgi:hypothetical protein
MYSFLSTDPVTTDPEYSQLLRMGNKCEERLPSDVNRNYCRKAEKGDRLRRAAFLCSVLLSNYCTVTVTLRL